MRRSTPETRWACNVAKHALVKVRVTDADHRRWHAAAKRERLTVSDWLRLLVEAAIASSRDRP